MANIIVLGIVVAIIFLAVRTLYKDRQEGPCGGCAISKTCCGGICKTPGQIGRGNPEAIEAVRLRMEQLKAEDKAKKANRQHPSCCQ